MITLVWGTHALLLYWEVLNQMGNSDLKTQKDLLKVTLSLLKNSPVLVLGDREFHCKWGIEQFFKDCKTGGYKPNLGWDL